MKKRIHGLTRHVTRFPANERMMMEANFKTTGGFVSAGTEGGETREPRRANETVEVDAERNEALEGQRPDVSLFTAVFGDDAEV